MAALVSKKVEEKEKPNKNSCWTICQECLGRGKKRRKPRKKLRLRNQEELDQVEQTGSENTPTIIKKSGYSQCLSCSGSGLTPSANYPEVDTENLPHVAIIGAGISGVALAVACLHRAIPFTLYERDSGFNARSQGYGLTLQQASRAIGGFGIFSLEKGVVSTRHLMHTTDGKVIGEWGMRKWMKPEQNASSKRTNVHIARQSVREALLEQLGGCDVAKWNHQLIDFKESAGEGVELSFNVKGKIKKVKTDLVVGADGIRSAMRSLLIGEEVTPLRYLGCIVILGICPLKNLSGLKHDLLDSATVFQTANGHERIYMMPYDSDSIMWQLSFPMSETEAKALSAKGAHALKEEACRRTPWHSPIPQVLAATLEAQVSGYPVYDRALLNQALLEKGQHVTLIGDAAHPMSPFKGQGANQALLDALALARGIFNGCNSFSSWREAGIRKSVLTKFEAEMLERSASKVKDSADAAAFLHSDLVLHKGDEPRKQRYTRKDV